LEEADQLASALQTAPRGRLRVYRHQGLGRFTEPVVTGFLRRYPEVEIDLRTGDAMIDLIEERFDIAVMPVAPRDSTLVKRRLASWRYVLCCAPRYLESHPAPQSPADLREHNCLLYTYSFFGHQAHFLDADGNPVIVPVAGNLVSTSIAALRGAAVSGVGLWMSAPYIVSDLLASGTLVPLLVNYGRPELEIVALYPHRRYLTAKVRVFIDMLVERFVDERHWLDPTAE
jgi:DNA-binding transcriptional LysR family regulator